MWQVSSKRLWKSQPFIGNIPAGNVLTSASILCSGAFPFKALCIFSALNCATISPATFFRHQSTYLFQAVSRVYEQHQNTLINSMKGKGGLVLARNDRADTLGHSAKYGTYLVDELTCHKVVDFKIVQVKKFTLRCVLLN